jgi:cytochrome c5
MTENTHIEGLPSFFQTRKRGVAYYSIVLFLVFAFTPACVLGMELSGKDVVQVICANCHASGVEGAPKIGDREAWRHRAAQGLSSLTMHALEGIRKMPAHGGKLWLSDLEVARAVTYMVNLSGGNWVEPATKAELNAERSGEDVVKLQCVNCHGEGLNGAPKIGDLEAWVPRMSQTLEYLVRSAIRGHGGMPPRGGQANLTDNELRSAILYMYNPAGMPDKPEASTAQSSPGADPNHKTVGGMDVYLGFIPAQNLHALPGGSPERSMHGGIPKGAGYYHVNISLHDAESRLPIVGAQVRMKFQRRGLTSFKIELEPMMISAGSYGYYINPQRRTPYRIIVGVTKPGATQAIETSFEHTFE